MLLDTTLRGQPSVLGMLSGAVSGLVAITPACGFVDPTGAFFIGFLAGPMCYYGARLKHSFGYDDALDAFGVRTLILNTIIAKRIDDCNRFMQLAVPWEGYSLLSLRSIRYDKQQIHSNLCYIIFRRRVEK